MALLGALGTASASKPPHHKSACALHSFLLLCSVDLFRSVHCATRIRQTLHFRLQLHNLLQTRLPAGEEAAIKVLSKHTEGNKMLNIKSEVNVLRAVKRQLDGHAHLCQMLDTFEDIHNVYIILEMCGGWMLRDYLDYCGFFEEDYARWVMRQVRGAGDGQPPDLVHSQDDWFIF